MYNTTIMHPASIIPNNYNINNKDIHPAFLNNYYNNAKQKYIKYKNKYLKYKYKILSNIDQYLNNEQKGGNILVYPYPQTNIQFTSNYITDIKYNDNNLEIYYMNGDVKKIELKTQVNKINISNEELKKIIREELNTIKLIKDVNFKI
jgi:hypothetical protein